MVSERLLRRTDLPGRRLPLREVSAVVLVAAASTALVMPWLLAPAGRPAVEPERSAVVEPPAAEPPSPEPASPEPPHERQPPPFDDRASNAQAVAPPPDAPPSVVPAPEAPVAAAPARAPVQAEDETAPLTTSALPPMKPPSTALPEIQDPASTRDRPLPRAFKPRAGRSRRGEDERQSIAIRPPVRAQPASRDRDRPPSPPQVAARHAPRGPVKAQSPQPSTDWNLPNSLLPIR